MTPAPKTDHIMTPHLQISRVEKLYPCELCNNKVFSSQKGLRCHRLSCNQRNRKFVCQLCSIRFVRCIQLANHMRIMHVIKKKKVLCVNKLSTTAKNLLPPTPAFNLITSELSVVLTKTNYDKASLLRVKEVKRLYLCELCEKSFATNSGLRRHQLQCGDKEPQFDCPFCSKRFFRNDKKDAHIRNMHVRKKHKAQRLNRISTGVNKTQSATTSTQRNTKGQCIAEKSASINVSKKYVCPTCGNRYNQKKTLENHLKSQCANTEKDVHCQFCPLKFYRRYDLKRHLYRGHKVPKETISRILEQNGI